MFCFFPICFLFYTEYDGLKKNVNSFSLRKFKKKKTIDFTKINLYKKLLYVYVMYCNVFFLIAKAAGIVNRPLIPPTK